MHRPSATELTPQALRQFGLMFAGLLSGLFGLLLPLVFGYGLPLWPWLVAVGLVPWAMLHPHSLIYLYRPWMAFGAVMAIINTHLLLGLVFFLLITPMGLIRRLFRQSSIHGLDATRSSYREPSTAPPADHMEHPY